MARLWKYHMGGIGIMFTEKEDWSHKIKDDLELRNRNWEKIDNLQDEFTTHLNDYATYKDSTTLKVAKVEKELSDDKATMQQVNINQEPKQKATGYGVISLPPNAANGQVSGVVRGLTATNIVENGDFAEPLS
ncbi:MAG: hypothetical protein WBI88_11845, partial [Caldicoprobacterales bacterium]